MFMDDCYDFHFFLDYVDVCCDFCSVLDYIDLIYMFVMFFNSVFDNVELM